MSSVIERHVAQRGAAFLDTKHPGWAYEIRLRSLNQYDFLNCVLGQLCGRYNTGLEVLQVPDGKEAVLGFDASTKTDYAGLTEAWKAEVRKRRGRSGRRHGK